MSFSGGGERVGVETGILLKWGITGGLFTMFV